MLANWTQGSACWRNWRWNWKKKGRQRRPLLVVSEAAQVRAQSRVHDLDLDRVLALGQDQGRVPSQFRARGQDLDQNLAAAHQDSPDNKTTHIRDRYLRVEAGAEAKVVAEAGAGAEADRQTVVGATVVAGAEVTARIGEAEDASTEGSPPYIISNKEKVKNFDYSICRTGTCDLFW